jgi:two-component sensor histidine kinase
LSSQPLTFLVEAGRALNSTLDLPVIYTTLFEAVVKVMPCDVLIVWRYDQAAGLLHCVYSRDQAGVKDVSGNPPIPLAPEGMGTLSQAVQTGQSLLLLPDYEKQPSAESRHYLVAPDGELPASMPAGAARPRSAIITPIMLEQQVVGMIQVFSARKNALGRRHLRLLEALALYMATAMTNAYHYQQAQSELEERRHVESALLESQERYRQQLEFTNREIAERRRTAAALQLNEARLEALFHLGQLSFDSERALIDYALEEGVRLTGSQVGYLHFVHSDQVDLELFTWSSEVTKTCKAVASAHYPISSAGLWADCVRQRAPVVHNDYPNNPNRRGLPEGHSPIVRHVSVPVVDQGLVTVVAGVANKAEPYDDADVRQLQLFAEGLWSLIVRRRAETSLRARLEEKEVLLQEVHHRVKNNLQSIISLVGLRMDTVRDAETRAFLEGLQQQARTMALVYDRFAQSDNLAQVDMAAFIAQIARHYQDRSSGSRQVAVEITTRAAAGSDQPLLMDVGSAMPCGLLVNELLSNAFEHAFPPAIDAPRVRVLLEERRGEYHLVVADNGIGLSPGFSLPGNGTLGLQLIYLWVNHQLGGTLQVSSDSGACFEITFPILQ